MGFNIALIFIGVLLGIGVAYLFFKGGYADQVEEPIDAVKSENSVSSFLRQVVKYTDDGEDIAENLRDIYLLTMQNVEHDLLTESEKRSFDCLYDFIQELSGDVFNRYIEVTLNDTKVAGNNCTEGVS